MIESRSMSWPSAAMVLVGRRRGGWSAGGGGGGGRRARRGRAAHEERGRRVEGVGEVSVCPAVLVAPAACPTLAESLLTVA